VGQPASGGVIAIEDVVVTRRSPTSSNRTSQPTAGWLDAPPQDGSYGGMEKSRSWLVLTVVFLSACGHRAQSAAAVQPLDPTVAHFGKTYAEWAAAWVKWVYEWPVTAECRDPIADPTGELCTLYQDDTGPVLFLAGTWGGGVSRRDKCKVPPGKALLVPILVAFQDNGGVPVASEKTDAQLKHSAEVQADAMTELGFSLDDQPLQPLDSYAVRAAPYEYTLPPEPNIYTCQGNPGVNGTFGGYTSGYFVLLPPLSSGPHKIAMSGQYSPPGEPSFKLDVRYDPIAVP
jgi:hypothetical protein